MRFLLHNLMLVSVSCLMSGSQGPVWKEFSLVSLLYFQTKSSGLR